jgi:lipoprotein NlpD
MTYYGSNSFFPIILMLMTLLTACTQRAIYQPEMRDNQDFIAAPSVPEENPDGALHSHQSKDEKENKYHRVKSGDSLYSIGSNSGHSYQNLALWNQIPPPYRLAIGQKIRLFKPDREVSLTLEKNLDNAAKDPMSPSKKPRSPTVTRTSPEKTGPAKKQSIQIIAEKKSNKEHKKSLLLPTINAHTEPGNKLQKQSPSLPAVIIPARAEQKKSIISIDNKRMIKLNFQWPVKGRVIRKFAQSHNKGIDIAGKMGKQSVRAAEAGKVVYSGQGLAGFGNLLILKHNDEYLSAYANNSRLLVKEGQQVEKGLIIAEISESESKPNTLHFEIRKNGNPVNPVEFLPQ